MKFNLLKMSLIFCVLATVNFAGQMSMWFLDRGDTTIILCSLFAAAILGSVAIWVSKKMEYGFMFALAAWAAPGAFFIMVDVVFNQKYLELPKFIFAPYFFC